MLITNKYRLLKEAEDPDQQDKDRDSGFKDNNIPNPEYANIITVLHDDLETKYNDTFKTVPDRVRDSFESTNIEIKNVKTKDEYVLALENLKDTISKVCDLLRKKRIEIFDSILKEDKYKGYEDRIKKDDNFIKIELSVFRDTNTYKLMNSAIDQIFSTIEDSVDFEALKIKNGKNGIEELSEVVKEKSFYGFTNEDTTEKYIGSEFSKYIDSIETSKKRKPESKVTEADLIDEEMPKQLSALIRKCFKGLNDVDKTVLKHFQNDSSYASFNGNGGFPMKGVTSLMSDQGIVCLCGMACNKAFPTYSKEEADPDALEEGEDTVFELKSISYKGGSSSAKFHYDQMNGPGNLGQFFELRVNPGVKVKSEKGRASIVMKAPKSEEDNKLVTKHGKLMSVWDTLKLMLDEESSGSGRRRGW